MKKFMYFAAALLVLVGCNKKENVTENAPQNLVTITGGIDFSAQDGPNKVAVNGDWVSAASGSTIDFVWETGDKIAVLTTDGTEIKKFTVSEISQDGKSATFTGEALSSGMENYYAIYPYEYGEAFLGDIKSFFANQQYSEDLKPYIMGEGGNDSFSMSNFLAIIDLSLTGSVNLGKIVYHLDEDSPQTAYDATLSFGNEGFPLTDQPQHVTFTPYNTRSTGFTLNFYDTDNNLIMSKKSETSLTSKSANYIVSFPTLEVKAATMHNGHEYVDLGLPSGIMWATMNVGATSPEGYGDYFAWGETAPHQDNDYSEEKYTYLDHDAANVNWGGNWHMPTLAEWEELMNTENCEWKWCDGETEKYNNTTVKGYLVTSKAEGNTNSIFLPAAGFRSGSSLSGVGISGDYWSSSLDEDDDSNYALYLYFFLGNVVWNYDDRYDGLSVRPVCNVVYK